MHLLGWMMDQEGVELKKVLAKLANSNEINPDQLKKLKRICRKGDVNVAFAFKIILEFLRKEHSGVRLNCVLIADELFTRSHHFISCQQQKRPNRQKKINSPKIVFYVRLWFSFTGFFLKVYGVEICKNFHPGVGAFWQSPWRRFLDLCLVKSLQNAIFVILLFNCQKLYSQNSCSSSSGFGLALICIMVLNSHVLHRSILEMEEWVGLDEVPDLQT